VELLAARGAFNIPTSMTSRAGSLLMVIAVWAALYLPGLGSLAIKGEEGRRILPGITMLQSGNYLVPQVGGETYFRKPPLINWLFAASFKIFGHQNEWTARLPSAICVLLVAIAFATVARSSLGERGSTLAGLMWLINAGIIEKGRLIEIEALYVSLCALAMIFWLSFWLQNKSPWMVWTIPFVFLGLGWLAKGPLHLVFFYSVVIAVVWKERRWRGLFHPAHLVGIALMLGIFAAWAIPFLETAGHVTATTKWSQQFTGRLRGTDFEFGRWIFNIPHSVLYLLPWVIFLPLVRFEDFPEEKERLLAKALAWGAAVPFVIVDLVPGAIPRYAMPAIIPAIWLLAMTLTQENLRWPNWLSGKYFSNEARRRTIVGIVILACLSMWIYAIAVVPRMHQRQRIKRLAAQVESNIPNGETIYALDPNYQPIFFYMTSKLVYAGDIEEVPTDAKYLLVRPEREQEVLESNHWAPRKPQRIMRSTDYRKESILLLKIE
jgi:4-amino-4-deoxy-L-arabinose transferase-like glycosyltransferase